MGAAKGIFVLFLRLENKELKLPFGVVAINRARQISQLWFWAYQLQLQWMETTANGHMTTLTVKRSLLEFSSGNKPFQRDWILWVFLRKRKCSKNFLKTTREESNSDFHRTKKNLILNWGLFWGIHKVKFDTAARLILRPKQLRSTISCCPHPRKFVEKKVKDYSRQTNIQESLKFFKMNTKLQAGKDAVKSFAEELLQSCRGCQVTVFAAALHGKSSHWFCHIQSGCSKLQCLCPTCTWLGV